MRVLHLFSNHKWTGPAEPVLNLCVGLRELGVEVDIACSPGSDLQRNRVLSSAREQGFEPNLSLYLSKHRHPIKNYLDVRKLRLQLLEKKYDFIHCHLDNDHEIAINATRHCPTPIVRSSYHGEGFPNTQRNTKLLRHSNLIFEPSRIALENDQHNFKLPRAKLCIVDSAVDTARFTPERDLPNMRDKLRIPDDRFIVGIVARMQTHRHYEDLFQAFHMVRKSVPDAHLLVIGRGTRQDSVAFAPVKELGLAEHVTFSGYVSGDDYVGALKAMNIGVYMFPGSDGTCRAVREMMAMGLPVIVAQRGMLQEIVTHDQDGLHFDNSVEELEGAILKMHRSPELRARMSSAALAKARNRFSIAAQAKLVLDYYLVCE